MSSQVPFMSYDLQQPNQRHQQMTETLLRLLADDTKAQKSRRSAKKAQGMIGDHQLITQPPLLMGSKDLMPRLTRPYIKLRYQTQSFIEGSLLFLFIF